jgi:hypothetical protein
MEPYNHDLERLLRPPEIPVDPLTVATTRFKGTVTALELATEHSEDDRLLLYYTELAAKLSEKALEAIGLTADERLGLTEPGSQP